MRDIKNIIFDLGGVIIDLDIPRTIAEFNRLCDIPFETIYSQATQIALFNEFDKGNISTHAFFNELKKQIRFNGNDTDMLYAWNSMLLGVPEARLDILVEAKQNYNTFLLSNTCEPHIEAFEHDLYFNHGVKNFNDYFDKVYYSCRIGMRKPDKEIFEMLLNENNLIAEETVFIDDSIQHVKSAGELGISSFLLPKGQEINDFLKGLELF